MLRAGKARRARWLVVGLLTTALVAVGSVAAGVAMDDPPDANPPDTIVLVLDGGISQFEYGGETQPLTLGRNECTVADSSLSGPIMEISATTFDKKGHIVEPAPIGLVEDGMGVNEKGVGNGQDCGRVDVLDGGNSEALTLSLGSLITGQMISSVDFDFEAKFDARVRIEFLRGTAVIDTMEADLGDGSDSGPDAKFRDKYEVSASTPEGLFDGVRISLVAGGVSLEGGATWEYSNESADDHRTVFHLAEAIPEIAIEVATNNVDADTPPGPLVVLDSVVTWTYVVSNPGDVPLRSISVSDDQDVTPEYESGDTNGDDILDTSETWIYSASGTAVAGQYYNTGSVSATPSFGEDVAASDPSHYFGVLNCGDSTTEGGPGLTDSPRAAFHIGPNSKEVDCAVPVAITSSSTPGGEQEVSIGPPPGFDWTGVTGIVTIEWDEESPDLVGVGRTLQRSISGDAVIPWCADVVVGINQVPGEWFYELTDPNAMYPTAAAGGDVCLIFQNTVTVDDGGTIFTQTTETFYIWNDPIFIR